MTARSILALFAVCAALFVAVAVAAPLTARDTNHAGLVVTFPDHTETFWIEFSESEITGAQLLDRAGLEVTESGFGGLGAGVCSIEDVGCFNPGDCFCQCKSGSCNYWVYFRMEDGNWKQSPLGASSRKLKDGDVDGWVWGNGDEPDQLLTPIPCATPTVPPITAPPVTQPPVIATRAPGASPQTDAPVTSAPVDSTSATSSAAPTSPTAMRSSSTPSRTTTASRSGSATPADFELPGEEGDSGGVSTGLIVFGALAAVMIAGSAAIVIRRNARG